MAATTCTGIEKKSANPSTLSRPPHHVSNRFGLAPKKQRTYIFQCPGFPTLSTAQECSTNKEKDKYGSHIAGIVTCHRWRPICPHLGNTMVTTTLCHSRRDVYVRLCTEPSTMLPSFPRILCAPIRSRVAAQPLSLGSRWVLTRSCTARLSLTPVSEHA